MDQAMNKLESEIKEQLERSAIGAGGDLERMRCRIDKLECAVSHLMTFIAIRLRLTKAEIEDEDGITDF